MLSIRFPIESTCSRLDFESRATQSNGVQIAQPLCLQRCMTLKGLRCMTPQGLRRRAEQFGGAAVGRAKVDKRLPRTRPRGVTEILGHGLFEEKTIRGDMYSGKHDGGRRSWAHATMRAAPKAAAVACRALYASWLVLGRRLVAR